MSRSARLASVPLPLRWEVPPVSWSCDGDDWLRITAAGRTDLFVDPGGTGEATLNAPRLLGRPHGGAGTGGAGTGGAGTGGGGTGGGGTGGGAGGDTGDGGLGDPTGDFMLSALVHVDFRATYDAGVLLVHAHERSWAKLCFEYSPQGEPMVVSVVTRGVSDDANAFTVDGDRVWLRVARLGPAFAFHASTDGRAWRFVRHFALGDGAPDGASGGAPGDDRPGAGRGAGAAWPAVGFVAQSPTGDGCTATFERIRFVPERLADLRGGV